MTEPRYTWPYPRAVYMLRGYQYMVEVFGSDRFGPVVRTKKRNLGASQWKTIGSHCDIMEAIGYCLRHGKGVQS